MTSSSAAPPPSPPAPDASQPPGLHRNDRAALDALLRDLRELHGPSLRAVALTGEAASADYRPRRSPLTVAVVLDEVTPEALRRMRSRTRAWRRQRIATPLVLDPAYIGASLDAFPLEFLDLLESHALLFGDRDPFDALVIDRTHLRLEVEQQLRGKLLHLWEAYLDSAGSSRRLRALLAETPPAFELILRGLLRLRAGEGEADVKAPRARTADELLAVVERVFGMGLPVLRRLEAVRTGHQRLRRAELESVFAAYLAEIRALVRLTDTL